MNATAEGQWRSPLTEASVPQVVRVSGAAQTRAGHGSSGDVPRSVRANLAALRNLAIVADQIDKSSKLGFLVRVQSEQIHVLAGTKLLHAAIWFFFAACIVAIPIAGAWRQFRWAAVLTGLVLVECAVLAMNRGRCPLTDLAGRYTEDRTDNFDIYLPLWLARRNKMIFGTLFAIGELFVLGRWLIS
jgi:hypothetical protein